MSSPSINQRIDRYHKSKSFITPLVKDFYKSKSKFYILTNLDTVYTYLHPFGNLFTEFTETQSINKRIVFDNEEDEGEYVHKYSITSFIIHLTSIYCLRLLHR